MKLDYLIDTNVFILLFKNRLSEPIPDGIVGYSIITEIEILSFPDLSPEEENFIHYNLNALIPIPLDSDVVKKTIDLRRRYRIKTPDAIIAASAWQTQATLLTNDYRLSKLNEIPIQNIGLTV